MKPLAWMRRPSGLLNHEQRTRAHDTFTAALSKAIERLQLRFEQGEACDGKEGGDRGVEIQLALQVVHRQAVAYVMGRTTASHCIADFRSYRRLGDQGFGEATNEAVAEAGDRLSPFLSHKHQTEQDLLDEAWRADERAKRATDATAGGAR